MEPKTAELGQIMTENGQDEFGQKSLAVASALQLQMSCQSWALEPAQICASLFCDKVDDIDKVRIAARVLLQKPEDFTFPLINWEPILY